MDSKRKKNTTIVSDPNSAETRFPFITSGEITNVLQARTKSGYPGGCCETVVVTNHLEKTGIFQGDRHWHSRSVGTQRDHENKDRQ